MALFSARALRDAFAESLQPSLVCLPEPGTHPLCQNKALWLGVSRVCVCVGLGPESVFRILAANTYGVLLCPGFHPLDLVLKPESW